MEDYLKRLKGSFSRSRARTPMPRSTWHQSGDNASITFHGPYNDVGGDQYINYIGASQQTIDQSIERITTVHTLNQNVRSLPRADSAAWNSYTNEARPTCFEGTRTEVLHEIYSWIGSPAEGQPQIYVLDGLAGIGKSTVARTVAEEAHKRGWLGASFFFSRSEDDRKSAKFFFGTVAFQLSLHNQELSRRIGEALERKPDAGGKQLHDQLQDLIIQPLHGSRASTSVILIVIDAFDECDEHDAKRLLSLLLQEIRTVRNLKLFFTTRPERHILNTLTRHRNLQIYRLHDIEDSIVEGDVRSYLNHGLSPQAVEYALPELEPPPWTPSLPEFNILVNAAGKLFIIASTAMKFLLDDIRCNPQAQMTDLMRGIAVDSAGHNPLNTLDGIYTRILGTAIPSKSPPAVLSRFHSVVGTIILLQNPLALRPLAKLLQMDVNDARGALLHLQSIISISGPKDTPRIYHKSFPDFITDAKRCSSDSRFHVPLGIQHARIARNCLHVMGEQLRTNICDSGFPARYFDNSKTRHLLGTRISSELRYACIHWATHLGSADQDEKLSVLLDDFCFAHLLQWLEVLSLIGRLDVAYPALDQAVKFVGVHSNAQPVSNILNDACRMLSQFYSIIEFSALHLYYSALSFTPPGTTLYQTYSKRFPRRMTVRKGVPQHWSRLIAVLGGHSGSVWSLSFSPDGSRLASGSGDKTARLWNGATGAPIAILEGHSGEVISVAFSPDGSRLASGSADNTVRLWDGTTGALAATLKGHSNWVLSVAFSPDGSRLASGSGDSTVKLWDGATGAHVATLNGHAHDVLSVAFSPNGWRLVSGSVDGTVRLWSGATGAPIATLEGHSGGVREVAFSPDGSRLASGSDDGAVKLWDGATGAPVTTLQGHSRPVELVTFSPDSSRLASGSNDGTVRLWEGATGESLTTLKGHSSDVRSVAFSPNSARLASGSEDTTVRLWDGITGTLVDTLRGHSDTVWSLSFTPDSSRLASGSKDSTVILWDGGAGAPNTISESHTGAIRSLSFSPDGSRLASGSVDKCVKLWNSVTGALTATLKGHTNWVLSVVFSPDSSRLASGSGDSTVRLWDCATGASTATLKGHSGSVWSLSFSPDGSRLASGSRDTTVKLWDGSTGAPIATLEGHADPVLSMIFSPDGSRIASRSEDNTVRLWNGVTGAPIRTLATHSDDVISVVFSLDGTRLACELEDRTATEWGSVSGVSIGQLKVLDDDWLKADSTTALLCGVSIRLRDLNAVGTYHIQGAVPDSNDHFPLLWLPANTADIRCSTFCDKSAAFGCKDGQVIILDLSKFDIS